MANGTNKGGAIRGDKVEIKTTTCAICCDQVSNRKSFAVANGRVCKSHSFSAQQKGLWEAQKRMGVELTLLTIAPPRMQAQAA